MQNGNGCCGQREGLEKDEASWLKSAHMIERSSIANVTDSSGAYDQLYTRRYALEHIADPLTARR